ncbi:hypothetical protein SCLCIDRAFT_971558 [Scleroderma citrinum Foug A]|uniref:Uncharacterized protein n=1 Tax=Scleroderma citrinum Foug A TaxID=1036808 RepID=A0A0C3DW66_9AGAM|nr:hypothetical protein SCLCIDRAFT_971558 [Scleroderma citrinum Foug A]
MAQRLTVPSVYPSNVYSSNTSEMVESGESGDVTQVPSLWSGSRERADSLGRRKVRCILNAETKVRCISSGSMFSNSHRMHGRGWDFCMVSNMLSQTLRSLPKSRRSLHV